MLQARALADPTRYAVFCYVDDAASPVGVAELTTHFGLNHNAIRQHLAKLRDAGLVVQEVGPPDGPGRPPLLHRSAPGAAERWDGTNSHERLTMMLISLLRGEGTPFEVGFESGRQLAREYGTRIDAAEVIETLARRLGFEPRRQVRRAGIDVVLDRCPFANSAVTAPEIICELHRGLAEGIAACAGGTDTTDLVVMSPRRAGCRIEVRPRLAG